MGKSKKSPSQLPYRRCAGIMVLNSEGKVWTGHRLSPENGELSLTDHRWQMPQGGIDKGEDPRAAALRELTEETGVTPDLVTVEAETEGWIAYDLPHDIVPRIWKGRYKGQKQKWFLLRFHGTDDQIRLDADDHQEFTAWCWLPADEVLSQIVPFKRAVYAQVIDAFRGHL